MWLSIYNSIQMDHQYTTEFKWSRLVHRLWCPKHPLDTRGCGLVWHSDLQRSSAQYMKTTSSKTRARSTIARRHYHWLLSLTLLRPQGQILDVKMQKITINWPFWFFFQQLLNLSEKCLLVTCITNLSRINEKIFMLSRQQGQIIDVI